ncbi:MAG TPA: KH domain-containing protein [Bacillota bacterium]|nr:KH domain-containing protein [Bacillota bacterium]HOR86365.1 KH domain-containing protein [Bacillota bacterium]
MKELVEVIAKALVDYPEMVKVKETENDRTIILELTVASEDMGKVIGKNGRIARAIRTIVKSGSAKLEKRVIVEIV